ncbi:hypothetical protein [Methylobacterium isbiliense]|uniref:Uncharacterized protein n=1 Tax=Methylobacterium isbiliense TaxID=315478 RepID=A0ABQ4SKP0_9HYPH|nr:hypothetical protein [Methylobacterium isbiliense]MDN3627853.1 hypothetical protein [Methylobacterium isbiliense]GJE02468.1 hypothetical protein GMJLKIPL_4417 [Methylobacterium isbiliense]
MTRSTIIPTSALLGLALTASVALAQGMGGPASSPGGDQPSQQGGMGMTKDMMGGKSEGSGPGDAKQGGCGMMKKMSALQDRVDRLEQRLNATQPPNPAKPQ